MRRFVALCALVGMSGTQIAALGCEMRSWAGSPASLAHASTLERLHEGGDPAQRAHADHEGRHGPEGGPPQRAGVPAHHAPDHHEHTGSDGSDCGLLMACGVSAVSVVTLGSGSEPVARVRPQARTSPRSPVGVDLGHEPPPPRSRV